MDMLYPTGLCGGTRIAVDLLTYEAVWSGEQVHVCHVITQEVEVDTTSWNLRGHTVDVLFSFDLYPCCITHQLTKINATLPYILIFLKF